MRRVCGGAFAIVIGLAVSAGNSHAGGHPVGCLKALVPLAVGALPSSEEFTVAACPEKLVKAAFRYDRARHYTRVARSIAAGEIVSRYPEFGAETIRPGQHLALVVSRGPVRVVQTVEALQPARSGGRLFVKTHEGQILSVRYERTVQ